MKTTLTVADIMAALPHVTLPAAESVELGRRAYAMLLAGAAMVDIEIELFATRDMVAGGILAHLLDEVRAGRLTSERAVA